MKINGNATIAASLPRVWDALHDPAVLVRTIPGCRRLETVGEDTYEMTIMAGVASIKGTYAGRVALAEPDPPHSFVLRAQGQGAPGTVDATVNVRLAGGNGATRIDYDADAIIGGMIGGVGQRMLVTVAKKTAGEFFAAVESALREPAPSQSAPHEPLAMAGAQAAMERAASSTGAVYTAPSPEPVARRGDVWAFGAGGLVALAGVVVGYALGRRARH